MYRVRRKLALMFLVVRVIGVKRFLAWFGGHIDVGDVERDR